MEILKYDVMTATLGLNETTINRLKKSFPTEEELYCVAWCAINGKKVTLGKSAAAFKDAALAQGLLYEASVKERAVRKLAAFCCNEERSSLSPEYYRHDNDDFIEGSFAAVDKISDERCDEIFQFVKETLTPLEYDVISRRCGFEGEPMTLEEVGKAISVTRERIRQIEAKSLRKLYRPQYHQRIIALAQSDSEIRHTVEKLMDERADLSGSPEVRRYLEVCEEIKRYEEALEKNHNLGYKLKDEE